MATRVLIVDDHPEFRALARTVLERSGFQVVGEVADGRSVAAAVAKERPDVVLLDVQLPDVNGFDVAEALGQRGDGPIVVMTSSRDATDFGSRLVRSRARGFIPKSRLTGAALAELVAS